MEKTEKTPIRCVHCNKFIVEVTIIGEAIVEVDTKCPRCRVEHKYILGGGD